MKPNMKDLKPEPEDFPEVNKIAYRWEVKLTIEDKDQVGLKTDEVFEWIERLLESEGFEILYQSVKVVKG